MDTTNGIHNDEGEHDDAVSVLRPSFRWSEAVNLKGSTGHMLDWSGVSLSVPNNQGGGRLASLLSSSSLSSSGQPAPPSRTTVLTNVSGTCPPFQLSAVMGLSGAGKSTLLKVLAGRISNTSNRSSNSNNNNNNKNIELAHNIMLDGVPIDPATHRDQFAFVEQHDVLLSTATAREAITFSAKLRMKRHHQQTPQELENLVDEILTGLRLQSVANTLVGSHHLPGLSGGEKRRVSLAVEIVTCPKVIFGDEVTSRLDSSSALQVIQALQHMANHGSTVVVTIHQPDSHIFDHLDNIILLHQGRTMFAGPAHTIDTYFRQRNYEIPQGFNTADWIIAVASSFQTFEHADKKGFGKEFPVLGNGTQEVVDKADMDDPANARKDVPTSKQNTTSFTPSLYFQWQVFVELMLRQARSFVRNSHLMKIRFLMAIFGGVMVALFMANIAEKSLDGGDATLQSHVGAAFLVIMCVIITIQVVMLDFVENRLLFEHEHSRNYYGIVDFAISQLTFEAISISIQLLAYFLIVYWSVGFQGRFSVLYSILLTFSMVCASLGVALASILKDPSAAEELIPITILPQLLLCGFFIAPENVPSWLQWASWCAPLTYTYRLFVNEEFGFCTESDLFSCLEALSNSGFNVGSDDGAWLSDSTTMVVPQYGSFKGRREINEYLALYGAEGSTNTGLVDSCGIEGSQRLVEHSNPSPGYCDLIFGSITKTRLNPEISSLPETKTMSSVYGVHVQFPIPASDTELALDQISIYHHNEHLKILSDSVDVNKGVTEICETLLLNCNEVAEYNNFTTLQDCVEMMSEIPRREEVNGYIYDDGNTIGCRIVHTYLARENKWHCPHLSILPLADHKGKTRCSTSSYLNQHDFFSRESFRGFDRITGSYGLNPAYPIAIVEEEDSGNCASKTMCCVLSWHPFPRLRVNSCYANRKRPTHTAHNIG